MAKLVLNIVDMENLELRLSAQRALLGAITPNVRAVSGEIESKRLRLLFLVDGEIDDDTRDNLSAVAAEIAADIPWSAWEDGWSLEDHYERLDAPSPLTGSLLSEVFYVRSEAA